MTVVAVVLALAVSVVGVTLFVRAVAQIVGVLRTGRPATGRRDSPGERWRHLLAETFGHTRMLQWSAVGVAHWCVFVAFGALFLTLVTAYGQLVDPRFALPVIGHWVVYEWASEVIAWAGLLAHPLPDRRPGALPTAGPGLPLLRLDRLAGGLRRAHHPRHRRLRAGAPRDGAPAARRGDEPLALPADVVPAARRSARGRTGDRRRLGGRAQDRHLDGLVRRDRAQHHDGGGLAPVHRLAEHLVQAARRTGSRRWARWPRSSSTGSRWTSRGSRTSTRTRPWASARSRTSPGRACSTSPPAPSAAAASRSARPGTPASRSPRSSSSPTCVTTRTRRPPTCGRPRRRAPRCPPRCSPRPSGRSSDRSRWPKAEPGSSTPTCCGPAPAAVRASSSARWTSSTSTTSSTCAATRC